MFTYLYHSSLCDFSVTEKDGAVIRIELRPTETFGSAQMLETPLIKETARQILEYFEGKRHDFDIPIKPSGTKFQLKVWNALQSIPYGQTMTYGDIAKAIGNHKAARAVGMANNKNPLHLIIPCHRVVGANGSLVGYAPGVDIKEKLLAIEKSFGI